MKINIIFPYGDPDTLWDSTHRSIPKVFEKVHQRRCLYA